MSEERKKALKIAEAGYQAIDSENVINGAVSVSDDALKVQGKEFPLGKGKILVIGIGKCSLSAAGALEKILGDRISGGAVLDVKEGKLERLETYKGTHPLPSPQNKKATERIVSLLSGLSEDDLVIFIISGGGSTLLYLPEEGRESEELPVIHALMDAGASIQEMNTVRKHMSKARGGYLAKYIYPARGIAMIFSDVPANDIGFISSGPTVKDVTTIEEAEKVLSKYGILEKCGLKNCGLIQTPKEDKYFEKMTNLLVVSNQTALDAMKNEAEKLGLKVKMCSSCLAGEAREVGKGLVDELNKDAEPGTVMLYGGETTVTVKHDNPGGRNQELALSALRYIGEGQIVMPLASDGIDNTDHAGAICDTISAKKAKDLNLDLEDYLSRNDSYDFWQKVGDFILTGDTGSNVSDLIVTIKF